MRIRIITWVFIFSPLASMGQNEDSLRSEPIYGPIEVAPSYPGGSAEMYRFIRDSLSYPKTVTRIDGKIWVELVVNEDGSLSDFKIVKGIGEPMDSCTLEAFKKMPNWIPGRQRDQLVRSKMIVPIQFHDNKR